MHDGLSPAQRVIEREVPGIVGQAPFNDPAQFIPVEGGGVAIMGQGTDTTCGIIALAFNLALKALCWIK
ncbi:hypothetical protein [Natronospirillum operosum]|uniref:hypothetical protein n=1 Tax=Natronospirillum operosum TaxID=2759953 RepID=UPI001F0FBD12|nr:hypothetical protein [Natronospirillum operosum]